MKITKIKITSFALLLFFIGSIGANVAQAANTPEQTVKNFYAWYLKQLNSKGSNPLSQKREVAKYVSKRLIKAIEAQMKANNYDADYFINAQDFDESWQVSTGKAVVKGNAATLKVMLKSAKPKNKGFSQNLTLKMIKEDGVWKIDGVR